MHVALQEMIILNQKENHMCVKENHSTVRVRFAPSPTGALHIGGARTAYFNWLFARQHQGKMILRIDDTDTTRSTEASYQQILHSLAWLGLDWDEGPNVGGEFGPYRQSERIEIYQSELSRLLCEEKVYACFCSAEQLQKEREEAQQAGRTPRYSGRCKHLHRDQVEDYLKQGKQPVYRLRAPSSGETVIEDIIRQRVVFDNSEIDDFIVWKADGTPTYHFASCVDDARMKITHMIRAEEHLSNTPRHVALFQALGYPVPCFAHVPMILAPDRSKLSKRHGATSVEEYASQGILPAALLNYLLLLGFSPGEDREIVSQAEAIQLFDLTRVAKHAAIYDTKKLEWINTQYVRALTPDAVLHRIWDSLLQRGWVVEDPSAEKLAFVRTVIQFTLERSRTLEELLANLTYYFDPVVSYDEKGVKKYFSPVAAMHLRAAVSAIEDLSPFTSVRIEEVYRALFFTRHIKGGELIHPTRLALTGLTAGPGLFDVMALLGRSECVHRMKKAIEYIERGECISVDN